MGHGGSGEGGRDAAVGRQGAKRGRGLSFAARAFVSGAIVTVTPHPRRRSTMTRPRCCTPPRGAESFPSCIYITLQRWGCTLPHTFPRSSMAPHIPAFKFRLFLWWVSESDLIPPTRTAPTSGPEDGDCARALISTMSTNWRLGVRLAAPARTRNQPSRQGRAPPGMLASLRDANQPIRDSAVPKDAIRQLCPHGVRG